MKKQHFGAVVLDIIETAHKDWKFGSEKIPKISIFTTIRHFAFTSPIKFLV